MNEVEVKIKVTTDEKDLETAKDYGQAAEQGTEIEKVFEAGFSSAMTHLVDEFQKEFTESSS